MLPQKGDLASDFANTSVLNATGFEPGIVLYGFTSAAVGIHEYMCGGLAVRNPIFL